MGNALLVAIWRGAGQLVDLGGVGARHGACNSDEAARHAMQAAWTTVTVPLAQAITAAAERERLSSMATVGESRVSDGMDHPTGDGERETILVSVTGEPPSQVLSDADEATGVRED